MPGVSSSRRARGRSAFHSGGTRPRQPVPASWRSRVVAARRLASAAPLRGCRSRTSPAPLLTACLSSAVYVGTRRSVLPSPLGEMAYSIPRPRLLPLILLLAASPEAGAQWMPQPSPTDAELRGLTVTVHQTAWASGASGTVVHTTDGGRT